MEAGGGLCGETQQEVGHISSDGSSVDARERPLMFLTLLHTLVSALCLTPNVLARRLSSAFLTQSHSDALHLLPAGSSTLLSVFPSPYINLSQGEASQAPDKKNMPPNKDLWNGNLALFGGCV